MASAPRLASRQPIRPSPKPTDGRGPGPAAGEARAWPTRQPHSGRVKLVQNFQKSIPSFQVANVASVLAVEAGLSLTAGLLEGRREDPRHGEARLHVVSGAGQAGRSLRNWPGWVSRSGRCPGTGQSRWLGGPTGGPRVPPIAGWPPTRPRAPRCVPVRLLGAQASPENPSQVDVSQPSDALTAQADATGALDTLFLGLGAVALLVGAI